jgi:hypothetical protein
MKWIQGINEAFFVPDSDAVLADEQKLRVGNFELLTVGRSNGKWPKSAAQSLFQFPDIHPQNLSLMSGHVKMIEADAASGVKVFTHRDIWEQAIGTFAHCVLTNRLDDGLMGRGESNGQRLLSSSIRTAH